MVAPLDCGWSDVGAWSSLWDMGDKDDRGNVVRGDALLHNTRGSYIHSSSRLVSTIGVENLVVVETADTVLVEDQSTYIPLELIEVQSGSYLGEDDIVRFEDRYGCSK